MTIPIAIPAASITAMMMQTAVILTPPRRPQPITARPRRPRRPRRPPLLRRPPAATRAQTPKRTAVIAAGALARRTSM